MSANVVIYTTGYCPYCTMAKSLLSKKGVIFTEIDVEERRDLRRWLVSTSGQQTVPQVFINGASVGGFSDISSLDKRGELDRLLAEPAAQGAAALPR